jgi:uncharacterized membrane protein YoaK (UPF0700 family)
MLRLERQDARSFREQATVAVTLSFVAGSVNASGMLAAGAMTSHMTGNVTHLGHALALHPSDALGPLRLLLAFLTGAVGASLGIPAFRRWVREPVGAMLLVEAGALAAVADSGWFSARPALLTETLCLAMGWQNALITTISGAIVRTTHLTGNMTDLGLELGRLSLAPGGWAGALRRFFRDGTTSPDFTRATLHAAIVLTFLFGAALGPLLFVRYGYRGMFAPAAVLVALVAADALGRRRAALPTGTG